MIVASVWVVRCMLDQYMERNCLREKDVAIAVAINGARGFAIRKGEMALAVRNNDPQGPIYVEYSMWTRM